MILFLKPCSCDFVQRSAKNLTTPLPFPVLGSCFSLACSYLITGKSRSVWDFPGGASGKESACQCRRHKRHGFDPSIRKILWRREWQPTPVVLPGKFHGQKGIKGYRPWDHKELDVTEQLSRSRSRARVWLNCFSLLLTARVPWSR